MIRLPQKSLRLLTLLAILGAGFSSLDSIPQFAMTTRLVAAPAAKETRRVTRKKKKAESDKKDSAQVDEDSRFLKDTEKTVAFLPEIFRCPECGYEQDEPGICPDHNTFELIKILTRGRDPLEPAEFDGNEDLIVDIPLKDLQFKKDAVVPTASDTTQVTP